MRIFCITLLTLFVSVNSFCQKEKDSIEGSISKFFDGLSEVNAAKLRAYSTDDFILLENGHVWNMDTLINKISAPKNAGIKRVNKFGFIKTEQAGNIAWVSYHNTADFSLNEKQQTVNWLESAVLKKSGRKMAHKIASLNQGCTCKAKLIFATYALPTDTTETVITSIH